MEAILENDLYSEWVSIDQEGKPLQVVYLDEKEGIILNDSALEDLLNREDVKHKPVAVISMTGAYRTGKSFLLNFLIRYCERQNRDNWIGKNEELSGFDWRQGVDRTTLGIYMWSKPFHVKLEDGQEVAILLMDTQGLFDGHMSPDDNAIIFGLSTLLSSTQVYNIVGKFEEPHLRIIELTLETAQMLMGLKTESHQIHSFQRLVYLVKDWIDPSKHMFGADGGEEYLKSISAGTEKMDTFSEVHEYINTCFEKTECFLMPHPGLDATVKMPSSTENEDESSDFSGQPERIDSNFKKHLKQLAPYLLGKENIAVKEDGENEMTGAILIDHVRQLVSIIKDDRLPRVSSTREVFMEDCNRFIFEESRKQYRKLVDETLVKCRSEQPPLLKAKEWIEYGNEAEKEQINRAHSLFRGKSQQKAGLVDKLRQVFHEMRKEIADLSNKRNMDWLMGDHFERAIKENIEEILGSEDEKVYNERKVQLTSEKIDDMLQTEEKKTWDLYHGFIIEESEQGEIQEYQIKECILSAREALDTEFNRDVAIDIIKDHNERAHEISKRQMNQDTPPTSESLNVALDIEEQKTKDMFEKVARGNNNAKSDSKENINSTLATTKQLILNKEFNRLLFEDIKRDYDEQVKVDGLREKDAIPTFKDNIQKVNNRLSNRIESIRGDKEVMAGWKEKLEDYLNQSKDSILKEHANITLKEKVLEQHTKRVEEIWREYITSSKNLNASRLRNAIEVESNRTIESFNIDAEGDAKETDKCKNEIQDCLSKSKEDLKREFNKRIVESVLIAHQERSRKVYDMHNVKRLVKTRGEVDQLMKEEEEKTRFEFNKKVFPVPGSEHKATIDESLQKWREEIEKEQQEKRTLQTYLECLTPYHSKFEEYISKSQVFIECAKLHILYLRKTNDKIKNYKGWSRTFLYSSLAAALGFVAVGGGLVTAAVSSSDIAFATFGSGLSFASLRNVIGRYVDPFIMEMGSSEKENAELHAGVMRNNFVGLTKASEEVMELIREQSLELCKHKLLNMALAAAKSRTGLAEYIPNAVWYFMCHHLPSNVYVEEFNVQDENLMSASEVVSVFKVIQSCSIDFMSEVIGQNNVFDGEPLMELIKQIEKSVANLKELNKKLMKEPNIETAVFFSTTQLSGT